MADSTIRQGRYYEEYALDDRVITQGRTITEADVVAFANLSGDWSPIHVNREYAASSFFGERIVHGLLGLAVAGGLATQLGLMMETGIAFMGLNWKFKSPIKLGDTIRVRMTVTELKEVRRLGGGVVTFEVEVLNQRDEVTQCGTWAQLIKARPAAD